MTQHREENERVALERPTGVPSAAWIGWVREQWGSVRVIHIFTTELADVSDLIQRLRAGEAPTTETQTASV